MNWKTKAKIMKICSFLPAGDEIYRLLQKTFGRLKANPISRIPTQVEMAKWILRTGGKIEGKTFFEVGAGHDLIVPIGFFLCGAEKIITVDLYKRIDSKILGRSLEWISDNRKHVWNYYSGITKRSIFENSINLIDKFKHVPNKLLSEANIFYMAPTDAANTKFNDSCIDYHISTTVLEHISITDIENIMIEAKRILKGNGIAIHFIDLSDHFQHQDNTISKINFLKYSEKEWNSIAGNQFAYCNRLRASEYITLFRKLAFNVIKKEICQDDEAIKVMNDGFNINKEFRKYNVEDICSIQLKIAIKKIENNQIKMSIMK